MKLMLILKI